MVLRRPVVSCKVCKRRAAVGVARALPTPTPVCIIVSHSLDVEEKI